MDIFGRRNLLVSVVVGVTIRGLFQNSVQRCWMNTERINVRSAFKSSL